MAETESTQGVEAKVEKYKSLYFRVETTMINGDRSWDRSFTYQWYAINFPSSNRWKVGKLPETIQKMPPDIPESATAISLDSQIYLLGGKAPRCEKSWKVFCFDTNRPGDGWKECPPMIIGREKPYVVAVEGKIYVFQGTSDVSFPRAEAFDPLLNEWEPLRQPQWYSDTQGRALSSDDNKRLLILSRNSDKKVYSYNVEAKRWTDFYIKNAPELWLTDASVVLDGVLYWYSDKHIVYAYDLFNGKWFSNPVVGLDKVNNVFPRDSSPVWLLHLGGGKLCLVWYGLTYWRMTNMTVYCTTFRVNKCDNETGEVILVAEIESSAFYHINGSQCIDFIAL